MRQRLLFSIILFGLASLLTAQQYNLPLDHYSQYFLRQGSLRNDSLAATGLRSLPLSWHRLDSVRGYYDEGIERSRAGDKLFDDHLIELERDELRLYVDLLLHFDVGSEVEDSSSYADTTLFSRNLRGFVIRGDVGEKVSFETSFRENQSVLPVYLYDELFRHAPTNGGLNSVAPGGGRVKRVTRGEVDHAIAEGYISYSPSSRVNIQFGHQKNFIGSGHRSLLLSDHAYTMPQLKATARFWGDRIRYQAILASIQNLSRLPNGATPESLFRRKGASFHYLEFRPISQLSIGLFEGVMWKTHDRVEGTVAPSPMRYVPLIGLNALSEGLDAADNSLVGLDIGLRLDPKLTLYGQYAMDNADAQAWQIGLRTTSLLIPGLQVEAEYNAIDQGMYAATDELQAYTHTGLPLAHPAGAGLEEITAGAMYFYKRLFVDLRYMQLLQRRDIISAERYGSDPVLPLPETIDAAPEDEESPSVEYLSARLGYMFNPASNFMAYVRWQQRETQGVGHGTDNALISFGIEMALFGRYEDY